MSEPRSEDDGELREWGPMSGFLKNVPIQARRGLFLENVALTCIDCVQEYLAVGTSIGVVYWYNRETNSVERLRPEKSNTSITCVKVVSSVDYMVAAGDKTGTVTVFKVPKPTPDWLPEVYKQNVTRQVERYTVSGLHSMEITALEWSMNGQKLFSGDVLGLVVYTEIDFYMNLSKACEILNEKYRIVQLSFSHHKRALLVATEFRCILVYKDDNWRVSQVGQKERTSLCPLGGTFLLHSSRPLQPFVYACRPGFRIWQADSEGTVQKTILFKESLQKPHPVIRLLRQLPSLSSPIQNQEFGVLLVWREVLLVTFNKSSLLVLDPQKATVITSLTNLKDLHSVALTNTEIFFIEGVRNIVRLSYTPDKYGGEKKQGTLFSMGELHVAPVADTLLDITKRLKEGADRIKPFLNSTSIQTTVNGHKNDYEEYIPTADEALELPPVKLLSDIDIQELTVNFSKSPDPRGKIFEKIGEQEFDDIISSSRKVSNSNKHKTKRKKSTQKHSPTTCNLKDAETNSDTMSISTTSIRSVLSDDSNDGEISMHIPQNSNHHSPVPGVSVNGNANDELIASPEETLHRPHILNDIPIPIDIQPDLRSPESILRDVLDKERLLAEELNIKEEFLSSDDDTTKEEVKKSDWVEEIKQNAEENQPISFGPPSGSSSAQPSLEPISLQSGSSVVSSTSTVLQMPAPQLSHQILIDEEANACAVLPNAESVETNMYGWRQYSCPEAAQWLTVSNQFICMGGPFLTLHCSAIITPSNGNLLRWQKLKYEAVRLVLSPSSQLVWKLDFNGAYALSEPNTAGLSGDSWKFISKNVECVSLTDDEAWYVSQGKVFCQRNLSRETPVSDSICIKVPDFVLRICCFKKNVWILTRDYKIMRREEIITNDKCSQEIWKYIKTPVDICIADIALGPKNLGWIIDTANNIYFADNCDTEVPVWWQTVIGNCLYENVNGSSKRDRFHGHHEKLLSIATSETAIWITNKIESFIQMNNSGVIGHLWQSKSLPERSLKMHRWRQVCAEGIFEENGQLWLLSKSGNLFCTEPYSNKLKSVAIPCRQGDVVCLAAARDVIWLLTEQGDIYIRQCSISDEAIPDGTKWRHLNLEQIERRFHLRHISCGCDVVWACDNRGDMHMVVGSPHSIPNDTFPPAWVQVEGKPAPNIIFTKVFVGPHTFMVWALDNKNNVYVREAIFPDFQIGVGWVLVKGIRAVHLSISGVAVWAVTLDGSIFRRYGISESNYIGDYWLQVPGTLSTLSVSVSDDVWGISSSSNDVLVHSQKVVTFTEDYTYAKDVGWEVVM